MSVRSNVDTPQLAVSLLVTEVRNETARVLRAVLPDAVDHGGVASETRVEYRPLQKITSDEEDTDTTSKHAGSDVEISYRPPSAVEAELAADPILGTARVLRGRGATVPSNPE